MLRGSVRPTSRCTDHEPPTLEVVRGWPWGFIGACWIAWIVLWVVMALFAKRTVERPERVWSLTSGIVLAVAYLTFRLGTRLSVDLLYRPTIAIGEMCAVIVAAGLVFTAWARFTLGGNWSGAIVFKEGHELVQSGPYRIVRHPIYTGLLTMLLGTFLDLAEPYGIAAFALVCLALWGKLVREERLMLSHFPDAYPEYRLRTKAIIPFVL